MKKHTYKTYGLSILFGIILSQLLLMQTINAQSLTVEDVLDYSSLSNVKKDLEKGYIQRNMLFPQQEVIIQGQTIINEILEDYHPEAPLIYTERKLNNIFLKYKIFDELDRTFLANVAHMIWVELHIFKAQEIVSFQGGLFDEPVIFTPVEEPVFEIEGFQLHWSLKNLSTSQVDDYLQGRIVELYQFQQAPEIRDYYHFKYYKIAKDILQRMAPFHTGVYDNHTTAISRFLEFAGDNFIYWNSYRSVEYQEKGLWPYSIPNSGGLNDPDFSDSYQKRIIKGRMNLIPILLARALNIPAKLTYNHTEGYHKYAREGEKYQDGYGSYRNYEYVYFPTINRWAYKHAIMGPTSGTDLIDGLGQLGEAILWDQLPTTGKAIREKATKGVFDAKNNLRLSFGVRVKDGLKLDIDPNLARSITCGEDADKPCGNYEIRTFFDGSSISGLDYIKARYGHLKIEYDTHKKSWWIPKQEFAPLDEILAYWPFDNPLYSEEVSLQDIYLKTEELDYIIPTNSGCVLGECLTFGKQAKLGIENNPVFARTNREFSVALWVKNKGNYGGSLFDRTLLKNNEIQYRLQIRSDGRVEFNFKREGATQLKKVISTNPISQNDWTHVVVTFNGSSVGGKVVIYLDGKLDNQFSIKGQIPMGIVHLQLSRHYPVITEEVFPAENSIGGDFEGVLDEFLVYFIALKPAQVSDLFQSYP